MNAHHITRKFEERLAAYCGSRYAVAVDNCANALFLALKFTGIGGKTIWIPSHTYPAVPCEIIHAGGKVGWVDSGPMLTGAYYLAPTKVIDSALHFSQNIYEKGTLMCLSFTGPHKTLKLGKGGAILTDDLSAYNWLKRARFSGRRECSYHEDKFDMLGWNFYMMPEIAARGLQMMDGFEGKTFPPLSLKYPDLSKFPIYEHS